MLARAALSAGTAAATTDSARNTAVTIAAGENQCRDERSDCGV